MGPETANDAFTALSNVWKVAHCRPQVLMARGLLLWRWSSLDKAMRHIREADNQRAKGASLALLAFRLCLSQWPEARQLASTLGRSDAVQLIDQWEAEAKKIVLFFVGTSVSDLKDKEVMPGVRQVDMLIPVSDGVQ